MNDEHDDISRLYQQTRLEEPPMKLDSAVLREARRAVEKKSRFNLAQWLLPLGSVAVVMLTATLFIQMKQEHPEAFAPEPTIEKAMPEARQAAKPEPTKGKDASAPKRETETKKESLLLQQNEVAPTQLGKVQPEKMPSTESRAAAGRAPAVAPVSGFAPTEDMEDAAEAVISAEVWLDEIRELQKQGKLDEARQRLKEFKAAYPDHAIPEELKALLTQP